MIGVAFYCDVQQSVTTLTHALMHELAQKPDAGTAATTLSLGRCDLWDVRQITLSE